MTTTLNASTAGAGGFIATSDNSGSLALQTAGTTAVTIDTSQQVGIGTTPSTWGSGGRALEIGGYVLISSFTNELDLTCNAYYSGGWKYKNTDYASQYYQSSGAHYWLGAGSGTAGASVTGFNTPKMTLDSSGSLLVNMTTSSTSTVGGAIQANGKVRSNMAFSTNAEDTWDTYSTTASAFRFYVDMGGTIHATSTSITAISDQTLKTNIKDLETGLAEVMELKPRRFDWINGDGTNVAGFISQEVELVLPDLVQPYKYSEDENGNRINKLGLKMGDMLPTLVKAIQELKAINDTQAETINALTARIVALESRGTV
jgi:hypothetical protein